MEVLNAWDAWWKVVWKTNFYDFWHREEGWDWNKQIISQAFLYRKFLYCRMNLSKVFARGPKPVKTGWSRRRSIQSAGAGSSAGTEIMTFFPLVLVPEPIPASVPAPPSILSFLFFYLKKKKKKKNRYSHRRLLLCRLLRSASSYDQNSWPFSIGS